MKAIVFKRLCSLVLLASALAACSSTSTSTTAGVPAPANGAAAAAPDPDPRIGLKAGLMDAGEAIWNLRLLSKTPPPPEFVGVTNSDIAFSGKYAIQGNYNGFQVWDISTPTGPTLVKGYVCPASQSDVSVYKNLLFVSGEGFGGRLDCGKDPIREPVSHHRLRGIRIFDITDITNPKYVGNVQTCRGSHTHSVLVDPKDSENVYVYVSGSAPVRPTEELAGCSNVAPDKDPNSALFRIEVIKVPLTNPAAAAIVSSPRIFAGLVAPPTHGLAPEDKKTLEAARARGAFIVKFGNQEFVLPDGFVRARLDSIAKAAGRTAPTAEDTAALRAFFDRQAAAQQPQPGSGPRPGPTQCHDITLYPAIGLAGGACEGYGLLIDISDPINPKRIGEVADSNFSYWHSATFNNDGTKVLFSDEWGGGGGAKCRATDPKEWGADALFTLDNRQMKFQSYYKLPVAQTAQENCVAHNGSLIPIPGRDVMVQSWYQGGISVFDWTDAGHPKEIAFFDRGPVDSTRIADGGSWSVYWYNGVIVNSEIGRGLDVLELAPSAFISQNEIDAAKTVKFDYFNTQGQQKFVWPASFSLSRAYVDQLERSKALSAAQIKSIRDDLAEAEKESGAERTAELTKLATRLETDATGSRDVAKVRLLAASLRDLAK